LLGKRWMVVKTDTADSVFSRYPGLDSERIETDSRHRTEYRRGGERGAPFNAVVSQQICSYCR
jgi:hypothetical protein